MASVSLAIETYKDLISKNPLMTDSYLRLANIYSNLGNFKAAIKSCDTAQENLHKT